MINTLEDFIDIMPKNLNRIIKKARFLYLELGKRSYYDTEYDSFMFGEEKGDTRYTDKSYSNPNIIICTTLVKQYAELLEMAGIKYKINKDNLGHYYITFYDEDGNEHIADITNDLKNIQFGCRTQYFGKNTISAETLKQIDLELCYITEKKSYIDDYWYILKDKLAVSNLSLKEKLENTLSSLQEYGNILEPRS